jgi:hypothetical protein
LIKISQLLVIVALLVPTSTYAIGVTNASAESAPSACTLQDPRLQQPPSSSLPTAVLKTITLVEETELYDEVFVNPTLNSITPQTVEVVDRKITYTFYGELKSWYKIRTWLGDKWILSNTAIPGDQKLLTTKITLTAEEQLYEFNTGFLGSNATISPQTVTVKAEWHGYYLIDTWLGERWIAPVHKVWTDIKSIKGIVPLHDNTELFTLPDEGCSTDTYLTVKEVYVIEQSGDWMHIRTNQGAYWINPKLSVFDIVDAEEYMEAKVLHAEVIGKMTKLIVQARLTDKLKEWSRPLQLTPRFALYDEQGMLLASNIGMGPIEFKANEINRFVLYVQGDLTNFKSATSQIYTVNNTPVPDSTLSWSGYPFHLTVMDPNNSEVRIGEINISRAGSYSVVRGKIQVILPSLNDVNATLTFYNDKAEAIGTAIIKGAYGNTGSYGNTTYRFEAVGKGDLSGYKTVKLQVNSLIRPK